MPTIVARFATRQIEAFRQISEVACRIGRAALGERDGRLERQVRAWAGQSKIAEVSVDRVDRRRLAAVKDMFSTAGWTNSEAEFRARLFYLALAGQFAIGWRYQFSPADIGRMVAMLVTSRSQAV